MSTALSRAKAHDLVTLPRKVEGTNCGNCTYVRPREDYCDNRQVNQPLPDGRDRMCCALWDAPGTKRAWEHR